MSKKKQSRWYRPKKRPKRKKQFMDGDTLRVIVMDQLRGKLDSSFQFYSADDKYYLPPMDDVREIVGESHLEMQEWREEVFDCDDFSIVLKANFAQAAYKDGKRRPPFALGIAWGMVEGEGAHAFNWVLDEYERLWFIEPQTDEIYKPKKTDHGIWFMLV